MAAVDDLWREVTAMQAEIGRLRGSMENTKTQVAEKIDLQTAAMNLVVNEAKGQFAQMKAEQTQVVNDAQTKFHETSAAVDAIWKGCEHFGKEIRELAQKVEQEKEGIKSVVETISAGQAQAIGKLQQQMEDVKRSGMGSGNNIGKM